MGQSSSIKELWEQRTASHHPTHANEFRYDGEPTFAIVNIHKEMQLYFMYSLWPYFQFCWQPHSLRSYIYCQFLLLEKERYPQVHHKRTFIPNTSDQISKVLPKYSICPSFSRNHLNYFFPVIGSKFLTTI